MPELNAADIEQFNRTLEPRELLKRMGYMSDSIYEDGKVIRIFCPIHKDQVRRSLVIDTERRTFKCQFTRCPVHKGGMLVELYAIALDMETPVAVERLTQGQDQQAERSLLDQGQALIEKGFFEQALPVLTQARKLVPENTITRCKIASLLLEMGQTEHGQKEYLGAAEDFAVKGDLEKTLSIYNLLLLLMPQNPRVRRQMAVLFGRMGRRADAAEHLKWVIEYHLSRQQISEVLETCEMLVELTPDDPVLLSLHMDALVQTGLIDQAVTQCEKAARLHMDRGEYRKARELVQKGFDLMPHHGGMSELRYYLRSMAPGEDTAPTGLQQGSEDGDEAEGDGEDGFTDWIASLEEDIDRPTAEFANAENADAADPDDARVQLCRQQLEALGDAELAPMEQFLRDMYQDVHRSYEEGAMEQDELQTVWEFYRAFCIAYEQIRRERQIEEQSPL